MMVGRFVARCQRGHELIEFTEPEPFERHMIETHRAKKMQPGDGWGERSYRTRGVILRPGAKPRPWKAPPVPKDWQAKLAAVLDKNPYDVTDVETDYVVRPALLTTGDVFTLGSVSYEVLETDADRLHIADAEKPERHRWFTVDEVAAKRDRVRLIRRAA